jgi:hypothetical protein
MALDPTPQERGIVRFKALDQLVAMVQKSGGVDRWPLLRQKKIPEPFLPATPFPQEKTPDPFSFRDG